MKHMTMNLKGMVIAASSFTSNSRHHRTGLINAKFSWTHTYFLSQKMKKTVKERDREREGEREGEKLKKKNLKKIK